MNTTETWIIDEYDMVAAAEGAAVAVEKSRDAVGHAYADAVEAGSIDRVQQTLVEEGRALFDRYVKPVRERRKTQLREQVGYVLDSLFGDEEGRAVDPLMSLAFPLGDGTDKTLRLWTVDDFRNATTIRYRNAANVTQAAANFDEVAQRAIDRMVERGATRFGDLKESS